MAIRVTCTCGKAFDAQAKLAGKTVSCPACGSPLTIPGPAPAPTSGTIRVTCNCGKTLHAKAEMAGKKAKCPACGSGVLVPATSTDFADPLENPDPFANDPLGLGDLNDQAFGTSPTSRTNPLSAPRKTAAAPDSDELQTRKLIWIIGGSTIGCAVLVILLLTVVLPAMKKPPAIDGNQVASGSSPASGPAGSSNPSTPPGFPHLGPGLPQPATVPQTSPPITEWITYTSQQHGFSVLLPYAPTESTQSDGGASMWVAACDRGSAAYQVIVRDPPPEIAAHPGFRVVDTMDALINAEIEHYQGQDVKRKSFLHDGRSARDVSYKMTQNGVTLQTTRRYIAANRTIYCLLCISPGEPSPEAEKFLDSFKLNK